MSDEDDARLDDLKRMLRRLQRLETERAEAATDLDADAGSAPPRTGSETPRQGAAARMDGLARLESRMPRSGAADVPVALPVPRPVPLVPVEVEVAQTQPEPPRPRGMMTVVLAAAVTAAVVSSIAAVVLTLLLTGRGERTADARPPTVERQVATAEPAASASPARDRPDDAAPPNAPQPPADLAPSVRPISNAPAQGVPLAVAAEAEAVPAGSNRTDPAEPPSATPTGTPATSEQTATAEPNAPSHPVEDMKPADPPPPASVVAAVVPETTPAVEPASIGKPEPDSQTVPSAGDNPKAAAGSASATAAAPPPESPPEAPQNAPKQPVSEFRPELPAPPPEPEAAPEIEVAALAPATETRLAVPTSLRITTGEPVHPEIRVSLGPEAPAPRALIISGLTRGARVGGGVELLTGTWQVPVSQLDLLTLEVPILFARHLPLAFDLRAESGETIARADMRLDLDGAASALIGPGGLEAAAREPEAARRLVAQGERIVDNGNLKGARLHFEKAVTAGSAVAALLLGASWDPATIATFAPAARAPAAEADPAEARRWYQRARDMGLAEAARRLDALPAP